MRIYLISMETLNFPTETLNSHHIKDYRYSQILKFSLITYQSSLELSCKLDKYNLEKNIVSHYCINI